VNQGNCFRFDLDLEESLGRRLSPDALVVQEDRNLVMGHQPVLNLDAENGHDAAYLAIARHRPHALGRYLLIRGQDAGPLWTYQAVVHDLDARPSCRPGDVRRSLVAILADARRRRLVTIASEPLGAWKSSGLGFDEMVEAFDEAIIEVCVDLRSSVHLTLLLSELAQIEEISHLFRSRVLRRASRSFRTVDGEAAVVEVRQGGTRLHYRFVPGSLSGYMVIRVGDVA